MMRGERVFRRFFDLVDAPEPLRRFVLTELASPRRHWHGLLHHALMLRTVAKAGHDELATRRLVLAVLFHDIVYDATRGDNEEASAAVARRWLDGAEADAVAAMILATKRHDLATDSVTRTLLEADLAILWTPSERLYALYADGIRREYAHVPDADYRNGRAAVLAKLRDQLTPFLSEERAARLASNLDGEIARLTTI
jgi:predicted metal-dependent HD superfamily phosphohydrolase